jgi:hypothetical protein
MLRAFFVIFILCTIATLAVLGFRGQKGTQPPFEIFPDMVRQPKVRAQAPLDFFADGRGPRLPVAGTVPVGYEMPKPKTEGSPPGMDRRRAGGSAHADRLQCRNRLLSTPAKWATNGEAGFRCQ